MVLLPEKSLIAFNFHQTLFKLLEQRRRQVLFSRAAIRFGAFQHEAAFCPGNLFGEHSDNLLLRHT